MESIISQVVTEWGTFGLILCLIMYLVYDSWKSTKNRKDSNDKAVNAVEKVADKVDNLGVKISLVNEKVDNVTDIFDNRIDRLEKTVNNLPQLHLEELQAMTAKQQEEHTKMMLDLLRLGPNLHDTLKEYNEKINGDHIFIGSFHNGNKSITGIPYYKFDIIAERFKTNIVEQDCEFAHMYKDADILRFDKLPILLVQKGLLHFVVKDKGLPELAELDDIIWRRMRGRGIRQIALRILRDKSNIPSGFVGVVKYDFSEMNIEMLDICGKALEADYHDAENNIK